MTEIPTVQAFEDFEKAASAVAFPFKSQFRAVWFHEAGNRRAKRDWLVKDLILARSFGIVYGPPGCGKSFLMSDLMLTCASAVLESRADARDWFGYRVNPFGVVYVVAEGADDFVIRLHAWRINQGIEPEVAIPFVFLPTSVDMRSSDADTLKLAEEVKAIDAEMRRRWGVGVGVTVIDTVSRALAGGNENASDVMGAFVINCGRLQEETSSAVIGVHHGGKEAGRGPRGHEALHGAADFEIEVAGATDESPNSWTVRKLKAGPAGAAHHFRLRPMTVDYDDDGDPITSCVVVSKSATEAAAGAQRQDKGYRANQGEIEFLRVLADAIDRHGVMPPASITVPPNVTFVVSAEDVRALFRDRYAVTEEGDADKVMARLRARWSRATKSLLTARVICASHGWIWMTGKKVRGASLRGVTVQDDDDVPTTANEPGVPADELPGL